jgi:hypothetical protein
MKADRQTLIDQFQVPHDPLQTSTLSPILALPTCYHKQVRKLQNRETHLHTRTKGINYFGTVKKVIMRRKQKSQKGIKIQGLPNGCVKHLQQKLTAEIVIVQILEHQW